MFDPLIIEEDRAPHSNVDIENYSARGDRRISVEGQRHGAWLKRHGADVWLAERDVEAHSEDKLIKSALGSCTGQSILDLSGGSGLHARQAPGAGAKSVDVSGLSPEVIAIGKHRYSCGLLR